MDYTFIFFRLQRTERRLFYLTSIVCLRLIIHKKRFILNFVIIFEFSLLFLQFVFCSWLNRMQIELFVCRINLAASIWRVSSRFKTSFNWILNYTFQNILFVIYSQKILFNFLMSNKISQKTDFYNDLISIFISDTCVYWNYNFSSIIIFNFF